MSLVKSFLDCALMYAVQFEIVTDLSLPPPAVDPEDPQAASTAGATAAPANMTPARPRNRRRDIAARAMRTASALMNASCSVIVPPLA